MVMVNPTSERPPWPDDMEEALTAQQERLRQIAAAGKHRRKDAMRKRIARWAVRIGIIAITFWLLCETVIS